MYTEMLWIASANGPGAKCGLRSESYSNFEKVSWIVLIARVFTRCAPGTRRAKSVGTKSVNGKQTSCHESSPAEATGCASKDWLQAMPFQSSVAGTRRCGHRWRERLDGASHVAQSLQRIREQHGGVGGLCVCVLSTEQLARLPPRIAQLVDLELSAHEQDAAASQRADVTALFDRTLRRAVALIAADDGAELGVRWVHVSSGTSLDEGDLKRAQSLGARTIALPTGAGSWETTADARIGSVVGLADALRSVD